MEEVILYTPLTVWNAVGVLAALMTSRRNVHHCATYFLSDRAWLDSDKSFHRFIGRFTEQLSFNIYREPDARTAACRSLSEASFHKHRKSRSAKLFVVCSFRNVLHGRGENFKFKSERITRIHRTCDFFPSLFLYCVLCRIVYIYM